MVLQILGPVLSQPASPVHRPMVRPAWRGAPWWIFDCGGCVQLGPTRTLTGWSDQATAMTMARRHVEDMADCRHPLQLDLASMRDAGTNDDRERA